MKIIIRDGQMIKKCLIQVKDVLYLIERFNVPKLKTLLLKNRKDLKAVDFINVTDERIARIIEENEYIVDFTSMSNYDSFTLSRLILLGHNPIINKLDEENRVMDLQSIISFKNGELDYSIPVTLTKHLYEDSEVVFGPSTFANYYLLDSKEEGLDIESYLDQHASSLYSLINSDQELDSFDVIKVQKGILVHFKEKKKRLFK